MASLPGWLATFFAAWCPFPESLLRRVFGPPKRFSATLCGSQGWIGLARVPLWDDRIERSFAVAVVRPQQRFSLWISSDAVAGELFVTELYVNGVPLLREPVPVELFHETSTLPGFTHEGAKFFRICVGRKPKKGTKSA